MSLTKSKTGVTVPVSTKTTAGPHVKAKTAVKAKSAVKAAAAVAVAAVSDWRSSVPDDSPAAVIGRDGGSIKGFFDTHVRPLLPDDWETGAMEYALDVFKACAVECRKAFAEPIGTKIDKATGETVKFERRGLCFSFPSGSEYGLKTYSEAKAELADQFPDWDTDKAVASRLKAAATNSAETVAVEKALLEIEKGIVKGGVFSRGPAYALAGCPISAGSSTSRSALADVD